MILPNYWVVDHSVRVIMLRCVGVCVCVCVCVRACVRACVLLVKQLAGWSPSKSKINASMYPKHSVAFIFVRILR